MSKKKKTYEHSLRQSLAITEEMVSRVRAVLDMSLFLEKLFVAIRKSNDEKLKEFAAIVEESWQQAKEAIADDL